MSEDQNENVPELPEGTEVSETEDEFIKALALKVGSPSEAVSIGVGVVNTGFSVMREVAGPFGEMAAIQALTQALLNDGCEDGLRLAFIRAAVIAQALESEESPAEVAAGVAERFERVEEQMNFTAAREAWNAIKDITEESAAEIDALEAAFQLPDADEPEAADEKGEN